MTPSFGLTLAGIVLGAPVPAGVPNDRIVLRVDFPFGTAVVLKGRTIVYEPPADRPKAPPAQAAPPVARPGPGKPFNRADVEKLVRALQAGADSAPLTAQPVRARWLVSGLVPWPDLAGGVHRGPDSVAVWAGAFGYEVLLNIWLPAGGG